MRGPKVDLEPQAAPDDLAYALASIRGLALLQVSNGADSDLLAKHWRHMREHLVKLLA